METGVYIQGLVEICAGWCQSTGKYYNSWENYNKESSLCSVYKSLCTLTYENMLLYDFNYACKPLVRNYSKFFTPIIYTGHIVHILNLLFVAGYLTILAHLIWTHNV